MKTPTFLALSIALALVLLWSLAVGERTEPSPSSSPGPAAGASRPAARPASKAASPNSAEVEAHILKLQKAHPQLVAVRTVFKTKQGRPIYAVTVTDPATKDDDKQNVLIIAGRHGNEETGRMIALALLDWLVGDAAATTRTRQKIVVMPNINPDGAEQNSYRPPPATGPVAETDGASRWPESAAWNQVAGEIQPELFIDMHARGGAGCSYGMVLYPGTHTYTEDDNLFHAIAADMIAAAEAAGIPQITHPLSWWTPDNPASRAPNVFNYRQYKSISFLTESPESNAVSYPAQLRVKSGLAKILTALAYGNRRHPKFYYEGYPGYLMGMHSRALVPVGTTAAQHRAGRVEIWKNFRDIRLRSKLPEQPKLKQVAVDNQGAALACGVGVLIRAGGKMTVASATLDGKKLGPSQTDGYYTWQDECSTFVVVAMPNLPAGKRDIEIRFE